MTKIILLIAGSILAIYLIWHLLVLPCIGWLIDRLTMKHNIRKMERERKKFEHEPSKN